MSSIFLLSRNLELFISIWSALSPSLHDSALGRRERKAHIFDRSACARSLFTCGVRMGRSETDTVPIRRKPWRRDGGETEKGRAANRLRKRGRRTGLKKRSDGEWRKELANSQPDYKTSYKTKTTSALWRSVCSSVHLRRALSFYFTFSHICILSSTRPLSLFVQWSIFLSPLRNAALNKR